MRTWNACTTIAICSLAMLGAVGSAPAQIWKHLVPASHVEAVPERDYQLSQEDGPWLIMVTSFDGDDAAETARRLAEELRNRHGLTAYVHDRTFDHSDNKSPGRGLDKYGGQLRTRYQTEQAHEYAVLVGDFPSIDDPEGQRVLERIKVSPSSVLEGDEPDSPMDEVRQFSSDMVTKLKGRQGRGPMGRAFFTRNPLLPREYFVPKGVDPFVAKLNQNVEHSLLDCPGRYTVQVATFRGKTMLQTDDSKAEPKGIGWKWLAKQDNNPLIEAAENAHLLTDELRKHGWDAYEFHDRTESIVTIGGFDQVAQQLANGQVIPTPEVRRVIETFGAAYNTPAEPLARAGNDPSTQRRVEEMKKNFNQTFAQQAGQIAPGMNPKYVSIMKGKKVARIIPMDVYPFTIEVPRRSVSAAYAN